MTVYDVEEYLSEPPYEYIVDVDQVYHLAARTGFFRVFNNPTECYSVNLQIAKSVFSACSILHKRVLFTSSSEVYGQALMQPLKEEDPCVITSPTHARGSYAMSKLVSEYDAFMTPGLDFIIARLFNTIGVGQTGKYGMVVPRMVEQALMTGEIKVFGSGQQTRTFCDVRDTVRALHGLMNSGNSRNIFNVGGASEITINELAFMVFDRTNVDGIVCQIPYAEAYGDKSFKDVKRRCPDISKIKNSIGWESRYTLNDTLDWIVHERRKDGNSTT